MAYVGISAQLIDDVNRNVNMMKDKESNAFVKPTSSIEFDEAPEEIIALLWGGHRHLEPVLPEEWKGKNSSVDLNFQPKDEDGGVITRNYFTVRYNKEIVVPPGVGSNRFDVFLTEGEFPAIPEANAFFKWCAEMASIERRWKKVRADLTKFLKSCKSLNEALKLWPDVRIYIPAKYLERVEQKSERAKAAEANASKAIAALADVDTDGAISAAVTARLMGSMQGLK